MSLLLDESLVVERVGSIFEPVFSKITPFTRFNRDSRHAEGKFGAIHVVQE
jgi:hypothetical protein